MAARIIALNRNFILLLSLCGNFLNRMLVFWYRERVKLCNRLTLAFNWLLALLYRLAMCNSLSLGLTSSFFLLRNHDFPKIVLPFSILFFSLVFWLLRTLLVNQNIVLFKSIRWHFAIIRTSVEFHSRPNLLDYWHLL